ncbi:hypothetical protein P280DRAFT_476233 [Massarina eburnea CBS 473.64]|uniref:Uncharacterized protein n=1 Tax=Massarina eburnea CBS 473.64 TaxID=1395130 RepID=A0A6A6SDX1_9PLEO|nr:hypothetical protein P280DRAFT_476233 [Massarina eburnea CBS 473.64]
MHFEALPPTRHISSTSISLDSATAMLEKYIRNSAKHAHLHPDARISAMGVDFSVNSGAAGGVVLHNLRRVTAGLKGEYLEPEPTPEPEEQAEGASWGGKKGRKSALVNKEAATAEDGEWMSMSEFEREEGQVEVGEVGDRSNAVQEGEDWEADGAKKRKSTSDGKKSDKDARKKAKKERQEQMKKTREKEKEGRSAK